MVRIRGFSGAGFMSGIPREVHRFRADFAGFGGTNSGTSCANGDAGLLLEGALVHPALQSAVQKLGRVKRFVWPGGKWRWPLRAMILMVPLMIVSVEVTSTSGFCRSCHI